MDVLKKGYLKTLEAFLAATLTFIFITFIIVSYRGSLSLGDSRGILTSLRDDGLLRSCVLTDNASCVSQIIIEYLPPSYNFSVSISASPSYSPSLPEDRTIFAESLYISGNYSVYSPRILRLYYWAR